MSRLRILFAGDAQSVHLQRWIREMDARGVECHVLTRRPAELPQVRSMHVVRPGGDAAGWFLGLAQVRRHARRTAPDIVHGHYVTSYGFWAAAAGRRPTVLTAWGSDVLVSPAHSRALRGLLGWSLRRADLLTGDSADVIEALGTYGARAPRHQILWGVDTERFRPPAAPRVRDRFDVLSLRAWEPNYNIDVVIDAVATLKGRMPGLAVHLHLLGGGPMEAGLRARAAARGLLESGREAITFVGRQDDAGMVSAMQRCHVSVSVPTSDATSVSLLESLACGMAIVATDLPANRPWVVPTGGRLVPVRDAAALAQVLQDYAMDRASLAVAADVNRRIAVERASRAREMDRMLVLYEELAARAAGALRASPR